MATIKLSDHDEALMILKTLGIDSLTGKYHLDGLSLVLNDITQAKADKALAAIKPADVAAEKLLAAQQAKLATIETDYQKLLDAGITYSGALFQSNAHSIATLTETLAAVANGWPLPAAFAWIDSANKAHPANLAFLKGLSVAMANHKSALFTRRFTAKSTINSATTAKAIKAVSL